MEFTAGSVPSLDGSEGWSFPSESQSEEASPMPEAMAVPIPVFARRHQRGLHRTAALAAPGWGERREGRVSAAHGVQVDSSGGESAEFLSSASAEPSRPENLTQRRVRIVENATDDDEVSRSEASQRSSSEVSSIPQRGDGSPTISEFDPWMIQDPWQKDAWKSYAVENENYEEQSMHEADRMSWRSSSGAGSWSDRGNYGGRYEPDDNWENWSESSYYSWSRKSDDSWHSGNSNWSSEYSTWYSDWSWYGGDKGERHYGRAGDTGDSTGERDGSAGGEHSMSRSSAYDTPMEGSAQREPQTPISPQPPRDADYDNRPSGRVPSGHPSVAGGSGQEQTVPSHGKIPSSYPPIFYARPGESWEEYWRSVTFWVASEGRSLPKEMQGPRLMQQLRERAAKIVQHLSVEQVSQQDGLDLIRRTIEASPIVKLLDQKRVDRRRQKFMKLSRLAGESLESFLNRADIYRRENQSSPAYQVGEQFYLGHLLDAAKLTKRDLALIKAAAGGALEDETAVTFAMLELADQLEGVQGFPIGRGEPQIDHEDKYLVQKASSTASTSATSSPMAFQSRRPKGRGRGFQRRRLRDALVAILEDDEQEGDEMAENLEEEVSTLLGDESCEEEDPDITAFAPVMQDQAGATGDAGPMAEIFAQEYKARNRVRQIKKMRQYFQKDTSGGKRRDPNVQKWVEEQQKTEPCFICRQLGHWSQECPYRGQAPTRAANVVHSANVSFQHVDQPSDKADWDFLLSCAKADEQYKGAKELQYACLMVDPNYTNPSTTTTNEVFWSMAELGNKMILDLGCMRTVAGTLWATPVVKEWRRKGWYVKVIPEKESFRFGDGHICESRLALIIQVTLASIPCLLRISVVSGKCPPLLSKPVASQLGLLIDTEQHKVASRVFHVKSFGLGLAVNGHYLLDIQVESVSQVTVPDDFKMPVDSEVFPLVQRGSKVNDSSVTANPTISSAAAHVAAADGHRAQPMGDRGPGRGGVQHDRRGRGYPPAREANERSRSRQEQDQEADEDFSTSATAGDSRVVGRQRDAAEHAGSDEPNAAHVLADEGDDGHQSGDDATSGGLLTGASRREEGQEGNQRSESNQQRAQEVSQADPQRSTYRSRGAVPDPLDDVQRRCDLEHPAELEVPDHHLQVEDTLTDDEGQECHRGRGRQGEGHPKAMEAQPTVDHATTRPPSGGAMGSLGSSSSVVQQPKDLVARSDRHGDRARPQEEGLLEPSDPNAPTNRELARRSQERYELVGHEERDAVRGGDLRAEEMLSDCGGDQHEEGEGDQDDPAEVHHVDSGQEGLPKKITLNRRQRRSIYQGIQKGLWTRHKIHEVLADTPSKWTLLEIFAGKACFSERARTRKCWEVMQPQDILYGLDLMNLEHQNLLKEVIQTQQPDVITLAPPCGPWSAWQRLRKNSFALRQLRRRHRPLWDFVVWVWAYQSARGALVLLEQPASSEALKLPEMERQEVVYSRKIPMCALGLKDRVSKRPHKKMTVIQMNHSAITTTMFREVHCHHEVGQHQPIEGSVRIRDPVTKKMRTIRRSTLAASWTPEFCDWLLDGLQALLSEGASEMTIPMHEPVPSNRIWESVPVEVETSEEGQIRQEMARQQNQLHDYSTKYEYISFAGHAALLTKRMRSTLAHLHVALGHVSNDKLSRMLSQNGAKPEIIEAVKQLQCQICRRVCPPEIAHKAAFTRPSRFNERIVSDSFHIWDSNQQRYTVTHVMCAFSMYMQAIVVKDANAHTTAELIRDRWIQIFGPPSVLMSDQGSEFMGQLEPVLKTFAVMHEIVPPTAHWRMALAERHGSILKLMMMKIVAQVSAVGMEDMKMVVSSAVTARNQQARISGFSPLQLVFGKDVSVPPNLMMAMEGQMKYHMSMPTDVEDAFRRASNVRAAAVDAYRWLETNEALRRAAGSKARLPRLELLTEGSQVMFWEPPAHRRGLSRRMQDNTSWHGPAIVVALERVDGAIKRVWVRYRHKLRGLPLEFVRLAVAEEMEAAEIAKEALLDLENQLNEGRVNADIIPPEAEESSTAPSPERQHSGLPPKRVRETAPDSTGVRRKTETEAARNPTVECSDEELVTQDDLMTAMSPLDDVPLALLQNLHGPKKPKRKDTPAVDPSHLPFEDKQAIFNQAFKKHKVHLQQMKEKLQPGKTGDAASSSSRPVNEVTLQRNDPREVPPPFKVSSQRRSPYVNATGSGIFAARDFEQERLQEYGFPIEREDQGPPEESDHEALSEAFSESLSVESANEVHVTEGVRQIPQMNQDSDVLQLMRPTLFGERLTRIPSEEFSNSSALRTLRSMPFNLQGDRHSPAQRAWLSHGAGDGWKPQATPMMRGSPSGLLTLWEQSPPGMRSTLSPVNQGSASLFLSYETYVC